MVGLNKNERGISFTPNAYNFVDDLFSWQLSGSYSQMIFVVFVYSLCLTYSCGGTCDVLMWLYIYSSVTVCI